MFDDCSIFAGNQRMHKLLCYLHNGNYLWHVKRKPQPLAHALPANQLTLYDDASGPTFDLRTRYILGYILRRNTTREFPSFDPEKGILIIIWI